MNQESQELVKQYITETLKDIHGIPESAYSLLELMMKVDRNLASQLHEVYVECVKAGNRYFIPADDTID